MSTQEKTQLRPDPVFVANHAAIDFLNSRALPGDRAVEWIAGGDDLLAWLEAARLIDELDARECRRRFGVAAIDAVAGDARKLREWFRGFVRERMGRPIGQKLVEKDLAALNRLLAEGEIFSRIECAKAGAPLLKKRRRWTDARQLLQPIADAMADLITGADFPLIRACEGHGCTLMFLDTTKSHQRRWCSMAICGNRAKAAGHRERGRGKFE